jgi:hypothetical protein
MQCKLVATEIFESIARARNDEGSAAPNHPKTRRRMYIPQTKTARQGRGSYLFFIVITAKFRTAGCRPRYLRLGTQAQLPIDLNSGLLVAALGTSAHVLLPPVY